MNNFIVGDLDCSFESITEIFRSGSYGSEISIGQWIDLAILLEIPKDWIEQTKTGIVLNLATLSYAIRKTLETWRSQKSQKATLGRLINVLKQLGINQIAENLEIKFKNVSETYYVQRPGGLFMQIDHKKVCIVSTYNVQITVRKLRDTFKAKFHTVNSVDEIEAKLNGQSLSNKNQICILWTGHSIPEFLKSSKTFWNDLNEDDGHIACMVMVTNEDVKLVRNLVQDSSSDDFVNIINDTTCWSDLSQRFQADILKRKIKFQGNLISIETFFYNFGLPLEELMVGNTLCDFISQKEMCIFNEQIPPRMPYYIHRRLIGRQNIELSILKEKCDDVFLCIGIERCKLQSLLPQNTLTGTSQEYLQSNDRENSLSVKHMTLSLKTDFDNIVSITKYPVHLFEYTGSHLKWIQSARSIKVVLQHISISQSELNEEIFLNSLSCKEKCSQISATSAVVLSDTPGMGKSYLLQNIARQLQHEHLDKIVILLNLSEIANDMVKTSCSVDQEDTNKKLLLKLLTTNYPASFEISVIKSLMGSNDTKIELLLDGFDEVVSEQMEKVIQHLSLFQSLASIRVWITTRPHHLNLLENTFQLTGYNIAPFTLDDQLDFLERFWNQCEKSLNSTKLKDFGKECLRVLNENTPEDHTEFSGIPLQCFLIAEVYQKPACEFALEGNQVCKARFIPTIASYTILELYEKLIQKKLKIYEERYTGNTGVNANFSFDNLIRCHMVLALEVLFPDLNLDEFEFEPVFISELLKVGLLVQTNQFAQPHFIHRTFAEYFASLSCCLVLKIKNESAFTRCLFMSIFQTEAVEVTLWKHEDVKKFWIDAITVCLTSTFTNKVIVFMVDNLFAKQEYCSLRSPTIEFNVVEECVKACVVSNCFRLLKWFSSFDVITSSCHVAKTGVFGISLVGLAVSRSSLAIITFVLNNFNNFYSDQDKILLYEDRKKESLLHIAAYRGDYSVFELLTNQPIKRLIQQNHSKMEGLVALCVSNTNNTTTIDQRIEILQRLFQINSTFIGCLVPHPYMRKVHVDLIIEIILLSADTDTDYFGRWIDSNIYIEYLLTISIYWLSGNDYHKLLTHTLSVLQAKKANAQPNWSQIFFDVQNLELVPETVETFAKLGAKFNSMFIDRRDYIFASELYLTCLGSAIINGSKIEHLKVLVDHGAKVNIRIRNNMSFLHLAVCYETTETEVLEYLVANGLSINCRTSWRETPLHLAARYGNFKAFKFLTEMGADLNAKTLLFKTPFNYAKRYERNFGEHEKIVLYLEQLELLPLWR